MYTTACFGETSTFIKVTSVLGLYNSAWTQYSARDLLIFHPVDSLFKWKASFKSGGKSEVRTNLMDEIIKKKKEHEMLTSYVNDRWCLKF